VTNQTASTVLDPEHPGSWSSVPFETLFSLPKDEVEEAQLKALALRFRTLRPRVTALNKLASRQGVDRIEAFADAPPVLFDHRVYKSYPLNLVEQRKFDRLTAWLQRLTTHDLSSVPLHGVTSVDSWLDRLDEHGMLVCHTTGTTGKLSFLPRSKTEWPGWSDAYFEVRRSMTGVDFRTEEIPSFTTGYRRGHMLGAKLGLLIAEAQPGDDTDRHFLYDFALSADLMSLAARLQSAEEQGELDQLDIDPEILEQRAQLIERSRNRADDLQRWFFNLAGDYRGRRVSIGGNFTELIRLALKGRELGIVCEFAPGSMILTGGGMKGYKDAPADWEDLVKGFYGVERIDSLYGMSECMGFAPRCEQGSYHFLPFTLPLVLDDDFAALPREGVQTGRMALFDLLAETYWGGFISGDRVTIHWDHACECGWTGPRIDPDIVRFSELEGVEDDKLTCAGTADAYNAFMDYVAEI
jgi:hypothetical protein